MDILPIPGKVHRNKKGQEIGNFLTFLLYEVRTT